MTSRNTTRCVECGSLYFPESSEMDELCPECAHHLYGYPNCAHLFEGGRCLHCHWDQSISAYLDDLRR